MSMSAKWLSFSIKSDVLRYLTVMSRLAASVPIPQARNVFSEPVASLTKTL